MQLRACQWKEIDSLWMLLAMRQWPRPRSALRRNMRKSEANAAKIRQTVELFKAERKSYFSRVESEVVQLAPGHSVEGTASRGPG